jgi:nucleoside-diphosphate-sugar epimerase
MTVLVTGSDGFIGRHLVPYLATHGFKVIAASRSAVVNGRNISAAALPDLSTPFDWAWLLERCDTVVHLAGIAHTYADEDLYDRINHRATEALARTAARLDKHLVFISSIAAQPGSFSDRELTGNDPPQPTNAYGRSKLSAEEAIRKAGGSFTILRPVVIHGEGEKGNPATIRKIARLPVPLAFGGLTARRSVLSMQNLSSTITTALTDPRARRQTFIVSDPTPVTVAGLLARYRAGFGRPAWLFPAPELLFDLSAAGQTPIWQRIGCPLVARPDKLLALGWNPVEFSRLGLAGK